MPVLPQYSLEGKTAILYTAGGDEAPFLAQAIAEAGASVFAIARQQNTLDTILDALANTNGGHSGGSGNAGFGECGGECAGRV